MITGKELHEAYVACSREDGVHMPTWEGSHPSGHRLFDNVAKKLNEGHITPLQGEIDMLKALISAYYEFNKGDAPRLSTPYRAWDIERNTLQARATKLLKEEK